MKKKENMDNVVIYGVLAIAIAVLIYSAFSILNPAKAPQQYQAPVDACGDLNDIANIQHLSHHPAQYEECLKKVNPEKFKEAVGEDLNTFMSRNNIG